MPAFHARTVIMAGGLATLLTAGLLTAALERQRIGTQPSPSRITRAAFTTFPDCGALLNYYRDHGRELVGPYGLPGSGPQYPARADSPTRDLLDAPAPESERSSTGTTVQVAGVDEADVAKRSGALLLTVGSPLDHLVRPAGTVVATDTTVPRGTPTDSGNGTATVSRGPALRILRTEGLRATLVGVLPTAGWSADQVLVQGTTVLLLGTVPVTPTTPPNGVPARSRDRTRIAQVDITDPARPRLLRTLDVDGTLVGARLNAGVARLAVSSPPGNLPLVTPRTPGTGSSRAPRTPGSPTTAQQSLEANRRVIGESALSSWLPRYTLTGATRSSTGTLVSCTKIAAPAEFSGLETLSLLSFNLGTPAGISTWQAAGVVASGTTLYATTDHAYVATSPWQDWDSLPGDRLRAARQRHRTWIHAFTTVRSAEPRYLASGSVPGFLLNQYALDEYHGDLRVASTRQPAWLASTSGSSSSGSSSSGNGGPPPSQPDVDVSQVTVLRPDGGKLRVVGQVGGIGRKEQIRAVRFIGPIGYVITFRQTDPLFTVDLSDPARPRLAGELTMLGYSAYLHPAGDHLLLGVGQAADARGARQGLQLSLFDVADPAVPRRVAQVVLPGAVSGVESDAHAFAFVDGLVLLPFNRAPAAPGPRLSPGETPADGTATIGPRDLVGAGVVAVRLTGRTLSAPAVLYPLGPAAAAARDTPFATRQPPPAPLRTFVDGAIWTVATDGVAVHEKTTLRWLAYTRFTR